MFSGEGLSPCVRLDQHFAGGGFDCNADAEERAESGVAGATAIETENEFVEIGLKVFLAQTVVDAERPGLQVGEDAVDPRQHHMGGDRTDDMGIVGDIRPPG